MLDLGNLPKEKQRLVMAGLIAVIVLVGGYLLYTNVFAGSGGEDTSAAVTTPTDPAMGGAAGQAAPGTDPTQVGGAPPSATPDPAAAGATNAAAPATAPQTPAPSAPARPAQTAGPKTITLFGSVTVTYPNGWGVGMGTSASSAVLSDGKGCFEVQAPDPKASDAKSIAASAVTKLTGKAPGSLPQGPMKIGGYDAYYYMAGGKKILGVDAPTRVVIVEYTKGAAFAAYSAAFDKMQSDLKFQ